MLRIGSWSTSKITRLQSVEEAYRSLANVLRGASSSPNPIFGR